MISSDWCISKLNPGTFFSQNRRTPFIYRGDGWNFGAPRSKLSSNLALFKTEFGRGERQRLEMFLERETVVVKYSSTQKN
jgi:hypothetical protein